MDGEDAQNVLRDVVNEDTPSPEDEDFALAKMMQEQERAFFHARNAHSHGENSHGLPYALLREDVAQSESEYVSETDTEGGGAPPTAEQPASDAAPDEIDDEELARRLHLQEQLDHQRRLMELAGIAPDGDIYSEDEDDEEGFLTDDSVDPDEMTYEELRALGDSVGVVSRGASMDIINALPFSRYTRPGRGLSSSSSSFGGAAAVPAHCQEEQCVVCRMEFECGEDVKVLPCKHIYHPTCIDQWLLINKACPICASEVTESQASGGPSKAKAGQKSSKI